MALIQPKPYMDKIRLRRTASGKERRRNMSKIILENGTPLPKPIEYSDIDEAVYEWLSKAIDVAYDGKRLPTYKLYSTQRISEYMQTWKEIDETGNPILNFKTITRENNPQKGENQGSFFNIPGHKALSVFYVPILQENGTEAFDKYTIKQPTSIDFTYNISIVTNKMEVVNEMNEKMLYEFNGLQCYVSPNGHYMPMSLQSITDTSEYSIDDRKYYSQTYSVKLKGYVIRKEDFDVERVVSRLTMSSHDSKSSGKIRKKGKNSTIKVETMSTTAEETHKIGIESMKNDSSCEKPTFDTPQRRHSDIVDIADANHDCCDEKSNSRYKNKVVKLLVKLDSCSDDILFHMDRDMVLEELEIANIHDFRIFVNDSLVNVDDGISLSNDDKILIKISRENLYESSEIDLIGYDPNEFVDTKSGSETILDEPYVEDDIIISIENE